MVNTRTATTTTATAGSVRTTTNGTPTATTGNSAMKNAIICNKERIANMEHALQQLISRIQALENENRDLKSQLQSVVSVQNPQSNPQTSTVIPEEIILETNSTADEVESREGEWITVVNKKNKVIKKLWKNNNIDNNPVGKNVAKKTHTGKQHNVKKRNHQKPNFNNRRRNTNSSDNFNHYNRTYSVNRDHFTPSHHGNRNFNGNSYRNPYAVNRNVVPGNSSDTVLSDLADFLFSRRQTQFQRY